MKTVKYCIYLILGVFLGINFTGCDDKDLGNPPRLFRPIASLESQGNSLIATWENMKDADHYELQFYKLTGQEADGTLTGDLLLSTTSTATPCRLEGLEWDEKYFVKIKVVGTGIESNWYTTSSVSIVYPTPITGTRTIDNAALIMWKTNGEPITSVKIVPDEGGGPIIQPVSDGEYKNGQLIVYGLSPSTSYKLYAYSGEEQTVSTYQGRISFKTQAPENFDAIYGPGNYIDVRSEDSDQILQSTEILEAMKNTEGLAIILKGGFEYKVGNAIVFRKSVTFITGLSLEGNAVFIQGSGFGSAASAVIDNVTFKKIDFKSDQVISTPVANWSSASGYGRQVYNVNGTGSTINNMLFEDCTITGYRAVVRLQGANDGVKNLTFNNCAINAIGDQGVVTTNNQATATLENATFENCTLTNIVCLCDLRASAKAPTFMIKDCTFCYTPVETTANANLPLFRFGTNPAVVLVSNSIFGPSMATNNSAGSVLKPYTAGTAGSILVNGTAASVSASNSYKTNFGWTTIGSSTYPLEGLESLSVDDAALFIDPAKGNYTIKYSFPGAQTTGALKWRMP